MVQERVQPIKLSLVIPAKDKNDPKLADLLRSIEVQDFPKNQMEVLVITEGTSESAKAIGIRQAKGEVIGILASDNELMRKDFLSTMTKHAASYGSAYPNRYYYTKEDDVLNRYFALIGGNDVLSYYMGKNDRAPHLGKKSKLNMVGTIGDNGHFMRREHIIKTDLDNYYHIDNALEADHGTICLGGFDIWHKTGGNIFSFFRKRYSYGLQHAFNSNRRWHLVDLQNPRDIWKLLLFIFYTLTLLQPLSLSLRGYLKIRDRAWFLHPVVCVMTLFTYALLVLSLPIRRLKSQLSSVPMDARRA